MSQEIYPHEDSTELKAFQTDSPHGDIVLLDIKVLVCQSEEDGWFAQGLDVDYAIGGSSFEDVKAKFEAGLAATVSENLKVHGSIKFLMPPAPPEAWAGLADLNPQMFDFSQISLHPYPYTKITYLKAA